MGLGGNNAEKKLRRVVDKDRRAKEQRYIDVVKEHGPRKKLPRVRIKRKR